MSAYSVDSTQNDYTQMVLKSLNLGSDKTSSAGAQALDSTGESGQSSFADALSALYSAAGQSVEGEDSTEETEQVDWIKMPPPSGTAQTDSEDDSEDDSQTQNMMGFEVLNQQPSKSDWSVLENQTSSEDYSILESLGSGLLTAGKIAAAIML